MSTLRVLLVRHAFLPLHYPLNRWLKVMSLVSCCVSFAYVILPRAKRMVLGQLAVLLRLTHQVSAGVAIRVRVSVTSIYESTFKPPKFLVHLGPLAS